MTNEQLQTILAKHKAWLGHAPDGERADLRGANLCGADLCGADLCGASLRGANLRRADLRGADLRDADLRGADLRDADLRDADLRGADLRGADLRDANLRGADLRDADLRDANLRGANLRGANLRDANLRDANLPPYQITQEGTLTVWKKLSNGALAKLLIPEDAARTASLVGRKCRAERAVVLEGEGVSSRDGRTRYAPGLTVTPDQYDPDPRVECSHGIHFFLTREEAEAF